MPLCKTCCAGVGFMPAIVRCLAETLVELE
jgi:hypothetical protein